MAVDRRVSVEITSSQDATKIKNVRFQLAKNAEFVSSVPALEWESGQVASLVRTGLLGEGGRWGDGKDT